MIDYKLAKKLKDSGFPQFEESKGQFNGYHGGGSEEKGWNIIVNGRWYIERDEDKVYIPTLSELIDACGDRFGGLTCGIPDRDWFAYNNTQSDDEIKEVNKYGKTPEESVAKLWLELNKK